MWWRGYPFRITLHNTIFSDELSQKCVRTVGTTVGVRDDGRSSRCGQSETSGESVFWLFPTGFKGGAAGVSLGANEKFSIVSMLCVREWRGEWLRRGLRGR